MRRRFTLFDADDVIEARIALVIDPIPMHYQQHDRGHQTTKIMMMVLILRPNDSIAE